MTSTIRGVQVNQIDAPLRVVNLPQPSVGSGQVRVIEVSSMQLITGQKTLRGHAAGTSREVEETMRFAAQSGVRAITEQAPLQDAPQAFEKMLAGKARYRGVLTPSSS